MNAVTKWAKTVAVRLSLSLLLVLAGANLLVQPVAAQDSSVAMTIFQVLTGIGGQQYYLNQYGQAIKLPGAGSGQQTVAVYTAPDGSQWYMDKNQQQQMLPPAEQNVGYGFTQAYAPVQPAPYYEPMQQQQQQAPPATSSSSSFSTSSSPSYNVNLGLGDILAGLPLGLPIYWGAGGAPYYYGAGGNPIYVSQNSENFNRFNEWNTQNNYWNNHYWNHNWNNDRGWWPGKNHGFPPPWQGNHGRLYSPEGGQHANQPWQRQEAHGNALQRQERPMGNMNRRNDMPVTNRGNMHGGRAEFHGGGFHGGRR